MCGAKLRREPHFGPIGVPVARRGAGDPAGLGHGENLVEERGTCHADSRAEPRATAHSEQMPEETEACDIGHRVDSRDGRQLRARTVEAGGRVDQGLIAAGGELTLPERGREDPDTERLAENQRVAFARFGVALQVTRMNDPDGREPIDRLHRIDAVTPGDGNACFGADRLSAANDPTDDRRREHLDRHGEQRQRQERLCAHGVDVGQRVGGGDAPEIERVVDDRHEEIGGGHHRLIVAELIDRGVVSGLGAHQEPCEGRGGSRFPEQLGEHAWRDLAAAAPSVGERGEGRCAGGGGRGSRQHGRTCGAARACPILRRGRELAEGSRSRTYQEASAAPSWV